MNNHTLAQLVNPALPAAIGGGTTEKGGFILGNIISSLVGALFIAGFLLAFVNILLGGFSWISAGGDKAKLEASRSQITNAMIGIVVVGASYALTSLIANFFGLDLKNLSIPSIAK